jgi:hypothetical protein
VLSFAFSAGGTVFCARCGEQIPDASEICPLCAREASIHIDPPAPLPALSYPRSTALTLPAIVGPIGIGGWLLFFCISLTVLSPLNILMRTSAGWRLSSPNLLNDLAALYGAVVGTVLWLKQPISLMLLRIYFIIAAGVAVLAMLNLIATALRMHEPLFLMRGFTGALEYVGIMLLWFAYFRKSARVRNTYGSNI